MKIKTTLQIRKKFLLFINFLSRLLSSLGACNKSINVKEKNNQKHPFIYPCASSSQHIKQKRDKNGLTQPVIYLKYPIHNFLKKNVNFYQLLNYFRWRAWSTSMNTLLIAPLGLSYAKIGLNILVFFWQKKYHFHSKHFSHTVTTEGKK